MLSFFCCTYKETYKLYALLRFILIDMPKNEVRIYNSKAVIYQNDYDVWQFRIWLADEDKYFRQSLRTKDKAKAIADSEEMYEDIKYMKRRGKKIYSISIKQAVVSSPQFLYHKFLVSLIRFQEQAVAYQARGVAWCDCIL